MPYGNPLDPRNPYYLAACLRHMEGMMNVKDMDFDGLARDLQRAKEDHQQERVVPRYYGNRISNSAEMHPQETGTVRCHSCHADHKLNEDCPKGARNAYTPQEIDLVQHPPHYQAGGMEAIDVIEAFAGGNYHRGNALKYLLRAGRKDVTVQDLRKAIWYIEREISNAIDTARRS